MPMVNAVLEQPSSEGANAFRRNQYAFHAVAIEYFRWLGVYCEKASLIPNAIKSEWRRKPAFLLVLEWTNCAMIYLMNVLRVFVSINNSVFIRVWLKSEKQSNERV